MKQKLLNSFRLKATLLVAVLCALFTGTAWATDVTFTFSTIASENNWANGTAYTSVVISPITVSAEGGGNNGKWYTSSGGSWRMYSGGTVRITAATGYEVTGVTSTPSCSFTISNGEATFSPSSRTDFTSIVVTYTSSGGGQQVETVATPTFDPATGTYTSAQNVTISTTTTDATIYYTTDGSNPTTSSSVYSNAIPVSTTTTIKAMAVKENMNNSAVATATYTINAPYSGADYVRVSSLDYLTDGAKVIIAARYNSTATAYYAMTASASGKPTGVSFESTTSSNGEILPANIVDSESTYCWTVGVTSNVYTFTNDNNKTLGYSSSTNFAEGGDNTGWTIVRATSGVSAMVSGYEGFYITNTNNTGRGLALNSSHNYGPYSTGNNNSSDYNFYVDIFVQGATPAADPSITANDVNIAYDATSGSITYTLNNDVSGGVLTAAITSGNDGNWLSLGNVGATVPLICTANSTAATRTAVVTLTYTYNTNETVTKAVTVTQAADPNAVMTIAEARAQATGSVTTKGVVTSVNGKTAYIQDASAAIAVYNSSSNLEVVVGDEIKVEGTLGTYNGLLQIQSPTITKLSSGNTVTPEVMTIAEVNASSNQGWLVQIEDATVSAIDGQTVTIAQSDNSINVRFNNSSDITFNVNDEVTLTANIGYYSNAAQLANPTDVNVSVNTTPIINAGDVEIEYNATSGSIAYTITNPAVGVNLAATTTADWISDVTVTGSSVTFTTTVNEGDTDRTATFTLTYTGAENKTVTVTQAAYVAPATGYQYELFTGTLVEGDYIIYYNEYVMKNTVENGRLYYETVTPSNDVITTNDASIVWHIAQSGEYWTIYNADANAYAASTGAKNKAQMLADGTDDKALWTVSDSYEFVNKANAAANVNANLRNNGNNGFACYSTSTGGALSLYKRVTEPVEVNSLGYSTFASNNALDFSESGIKAFYATVGGDVLTFHEITKVPANTGVLLYKAGGTDEAVNVPVFTGAAEAVTGNVFVQGTGAAVSYAAYDQNYILFNGEDGLGFYQANNNTVATNRAYIHINGTGVKSFFAINFDAIVDGIKTIDNSQEPMANGQIYNLAGQRMSKMQKGINIVNGKKVLVK